MHVHRVATVVAVALVAGAAPSMSFAPPDATALFLGVPSGGEFELPYHGGRERFGPTLHAREGAKPIDPLAVVPVPPLTARYAFPTNASPISLGNLPDEGLGAAYRNAVALSLTLDEVTAMIPPARGAPAAEVAEAVQGLLGPAALDGVTAKSSAATTAPVQGRRR